MNKTSIIQLKIWSDKKFKSLAESTRYLYLYLLTSPHANNLGLFYLPISYISCDLNWNNDNTINNIKILESKNFIKYDMENEVVFISNYLKYNNDFWQNKNNIKKLNKYIFNIPETYLFLDLKKSFLTYIKNNQEYFISIFESLPNVLQGYQLIKNNIDESISPRSSSAELFLNNTFTPINDTIKEESVAEDNKVNVNSLPNKDILNTSSTNESQKIEEKIEPAHTRRPRKNKKDMTLDELSYETFYENYPRKEAKTPGRKAFLKLINTKSLNITAGMLIESAKNYNNFCLANNRETEYIKLPATFLGKSEAFRDYLPKATNCQNEINTNNNNNENLPKNSLDNYEIAMENQFPPNDDFNI